MNYKHTFPFWLERIVLPIMLLIVWPAISWAQISNSTPIWYQPKKMGANTKNSDIKNPETKSPEIKFQLDPKGEVFQLGPYFFDSDSVTLDMVNLEALKPDSFAVAPKGSMDKDLAPLQSVLVVNWPEKSFSSGQMELRDENDKALWTTSFTPEEISAWQIKISELKKKFSPSSTNYSWNLISGSQLALWDWPSLPTTKEKLQLCISSSDSSSTLCSRFFTIQKTNPLELAFENEVVSAEVRINQAPVPLKGTLIFDSDQKVQVLLSSGARFHFYLQPVKMQISKELPKGTLLENQELFRPPTNDLSTVLNLVGSQNGINIHGDLTYRFWFERLPFLTDSYRRWGYTAQVFRSLYGASTTKGEDGVVSGFKLDGRYRFNPGVWNYEETTGLSLGIHRFAFLGSQVNLLSTGFFWAHSMPKFFTQFIDRIKFLNYPKYVDFNLYYFPTTVADTSKTKNSWALTFRAKVLWTPKVFGEFGYSGRMYNIEDVEAQKMNSLFLYYLTAGFGLNF